MNDEDSETWLLNAGHEVIEKKVAHDYASLSPIERLIYCLWVADYGMRNAGDLITAADLYPPFLSEGRSAAGVLGLPRSIAAFSLASSELELRYFELFDGMVEEIRAA